MLATRVSGPIECSMTVYYQTESVIDFIKSTQVFFTLFWDLRDTFTRRWNRFV